MFTTRQFTRLVVNSLNKKRFTSKLFLQQPKKVSPVVALSLAGISLSGAYFMAITESASYNVEDVKKDLAKAISDDAERRGDGRDNLFNSSLVLLSPLGTSMAPTLVRLAWHASGTYDARDGSGGSNGATMRFPQESEWGANAGLKIARDFLEPIKQKYPSITYADLWTLAGATAIEEMGGPQIPWRGGRVDSTAPTTVPDGRLPAADSGCVAADVAHLRSIFGRMGFSDREIVALAGAHAVGRCHTEASGYWGPWTNAETTFSNEYFRLLLEEKWTPKKTHNGKVRIPSISLSLPSPSCLFLALVTEMDWSCSI
jgi:hypothetical protein